MVSFKLLDQLSVKELRQELRDRYEKLGGTKEVLTARLRQALIDEEEDPDAYVFEIKPEIYELIHVIDKMHEGIVAMCKQMNSMGNKVDEMVSQVEGQIDQIDQIESQVKG